jgi:PhnB protein
MPVQLDPYLSFGDGKARDAMEFYKSVFGGTLEVMTFGDQPDSDPDLADKVMHSYLGGDNGIHLMGADTAPGMGEATASGTQCSLSGDDDAVLRGYWDALVDGGTVTVPLETAPWGDAFGMLVDKFGVPWMVNIQTATMAERQA